MSKAGKNHFYGRTCLSNILRNKKNMNFGYFLYKKFRNESLWPPS